MNTHEHAVYMPRHQTGWSSPEESKPRHFPWRVSVVGIIHSNKQARLWSFLSLSILWGIMVCRRWLICILRFQSDLLLNINWLINPKTSFSETWLEIILRLHFWLYDITGKQNLLDILNSSWPYNYSAWNDHEFPLRSSVQVAYL